MEKTFELFLSEMDKNPPAFPFNFDAGDGVRTFVCSGVTMRDYFAGQALAGMCVENVSLGLNAGASEAEVLEARRAYWDATARASYLAADAMLAARNSQPE
jgi:hypothetical protein